MAEPEIGSRHFLNNDRASFTSGGGGRFNHQVSTQRPPLEKTQLATAPNHYNHPLDPVVKATMRSALYRVRNIHFGGVTLQCLWLGGRLKDVRISHRTELRTGLGKATYACPNSKGIPFLCFFSFVGGGGVGRDSQVQNTCGLYPLWVDSHILQSFRI